mmetsp:Transcript_56304/g.136534  ORF Transcript_56304/g.136534 Transcript_56304/m.136534 type:complete len:1030 (-) Transcript_56304:58-3147(-)
MVRKRSKSPASSSSGFGTGSQRTVLVKYDESFSSWYDYGKDLPGRDDTLASIANAAAAVAKSEGDSTDPSNDKKKISKRPPPRKNNPDTVRKFRAMADDVYQNELRLFSNQTRGGSGKNNGEPSSSSNSSAADERWMENAMKKGTLKDRIAAMSVTVASSPIHKLYALDGLLSMVGCFTSSSHNNNQNTKPNSRVAQLAAEAIEDLFLNTLLPPDRKLVSIGQRPLYLYDDDNNNKKNNTKHTMSPRILLLWRYEELIKEKYDNFARQYIARTLEDSSTEQQKVAVLNTAATLLSSVPENESMLLTLIVNKLGDPDRKVASAAGHRLRLVLQQHSTMQTVVAREVQQLAHRPHLSSKALYNCITFLNQLQLRRTTPEDQAVAASLVKTYFRLFEVAVDNQKLRNEKSAKKKKGKRQSSSSGNQDHQSGGGSMKGRLLSALLMGVNRAHPYLPEKDQDMKDHVDALYRIVHTAPPSAATQALLLLFHLAVGSVLEAERQEENQTNYDNEQQKKDTKDHQRDRYYRALYATLSKPSMVTTGKHLTMYFNALYKAMKYDSNQNRVHAFAKRLLAAVIHGPSPTTAAALYMLQEISETHPSLQSSWQDIPMPESNAWVALDDTKREPKAALVDKQINEDQDEDKEAGTSESRILIPPMWEVSALGLHFHPSVAKFANDLGQIEFDGDPLHDFGLSQFLDKFAYRNPKSREKLLKQQPKSAGAMHSRQASKLQSRLATPLNDKSFLEETNVNEQDEFFHRFFVERARRDEIKDIAQHNSSKDSDDDDDDDGNWKDTNQDEDDAFNAAEDAEDIDSRFKTFEEYEAEWEIDEEEEEFVDSLAMSLMESEVGVPADIDDEPEGMEHWGDDVIGDGPDIDDEDVEIDEKTKSKIAKKTSNDDDSASSDDSESSDEEPDIDESEIVDALAAASDNSGSDNDESDDDDSDDLDMALLDDSEESGDDDNHDDEDGDIDMDHDDLNHFADAAEYEEIIAKSFAELKKKRQTLEEEEEEEEVEDTPAKSRTPKGSNKKRRRS